MRNYSNVTKSSLRDGLYFNDFRRVKIDLENEKLKTFTNLGLIQFPFKNKYAWHLTIRISTNYIFTNPDIVKSEIKIQNEIESKLANLINGHCNLKPVAKVLNEDFKELHWYIACPNIDYKSFKHIIDEIKQIRNISFNISEDPNWQEVGMFFKAVG